MKKRILFLIESLSGGGAEKVLTVLLKHFDYTHYDVTICPVVDEGVYCEEVKKYVSHYCPLVTFKGNVLSRLINHVRCRLIYNWLPLSLVYRWFVPKGNDVEIAFCEGFGTKLLAHSKSKAKKIAWIHTDLITNPWPIEEGVFKDEKEQQEAYAAFDKIVCVSHTVEKTFLEKYGLEERTYTIYNTIDIKDILEKVGDRQVRKDNIFRLISIGRLVPQKGYDRLLHVVRQLREEGHHLYLLILGEGVERAALENYISENNMQSYVSLPGFVKNPYKYLANSDLFVCSSRAEGFSLVIAEAMALEIPVLSTNCSGPNELLQEGECGMLVENSEEGLRDGINKFIKHSDNKMELIEHAKESLIRFLPQHIVACVEGIINP